MHSVQPIDCRIEKEIRAPLEVVLRCMEDAGIGGEVSQLLEDVLLNVDCLRLLLRLKLDSTGGISLLNPRMEGADDALLPCLVETDQDSRWIAVRVHQVLEEDLDSDATNDDERADLFEIRELLELEMGADDDDSPMEPEGLPIEELVTERIPLPWMVRPAQRVVLSHEDGL